MLISCKVLYLYLYLYLYLSLSLSLYLYLSVNSSLPCPEVKNTYPHENISRQKS